VTGRSPISAEIRAFIVQMAKANGSWGYTRIQGALANLDHDVSRGTIATILRAHGQPVTSSLPMSTSRRGAHPSAARNSARPVWCPCTRRPATYSPSTCADANAIGGSVRCPPLCSSPAGTIAWIAEIFIARSTYCVGKLVCGARPPAMDRGSTT
jgi:hypothetical protein